MRGPGPPTSATGVSLRDADIPAATMASWRVDTPSFR